MELKSSVVECWDIFEASFHSRAELSNPFTEVALSAVFECGDERKTVSGFYDGEGNWKIRFMPGTVGEYRFLTLSNIGELNQISGSFRATPPTPGNHGQVRTQGDCFAYQDGTPAFICGTTVYAWWYRPDEICEQTLASLKKVGFNKVRMLALPKYIAGMSEIDLTYEPPCLPFEGKKNAFDFARPVVGYFRRLEQKIADLRKAGIEADVILFHFYDFGTWGIDEGMSDEAAKLYLSYLIARIGAFRNVWWSLANEYDIYAHPEGYRYKLDRRNWDGIGTYLMENDPFDHLRSIHNWGVIYPDRPWMTHASYQHPNTFSLLMMLKTRYDGKPVIAEEYQYEGNLSYGWGNLTGMQETQRHLLAVMAGGYATHGECFSINGNRKDIFWAYGGEMTGQSAPRIGYFKKLFESMPFNRLCPDLALGDGMTRFALRDGYKTLFFLYLPECPEKDRIFGLGCTDGKRHKYNARIYDLWDMKVVRELNCVDVTFDAMKLNADGLVCVMLEESGSL